MVAPVQVNVQRPDVVDVEACWPEVNIWQLLIRSGWKWTFSTTRPVSAHNPSASTRPMCETLKVSLSSQDLVPGPLSQDSRPRTPVPGPPSRHRGHASAQRSEEPRLKSLRTPEGAEDPFLDLVHARLSFWLGLLLKMPLTPKRRISNCVEGSSLTCEVTKVTLK